MAHKSHLGWEIAPTPALEGPYGQTSTIFDDSKDKVREGLKSSALQAALRSPAP